jgi:hypothetical protein
MYPGPNTVLLSLPSRSVPCELLSSQKLINSFFLDICNLLHDDREAGRSALYHHNFCFLCHPLLLRDVPTKYQPSGAASRCLGMTDHGLSPARSPIPPQRSQRKRESTLRRRIQYMLVNTTGLSFLLLTSILKTTMSSHPNPLRRPAVMLCSLRTPLSTVKASLTGKAYGPKARATGLRSTRRTRPGWKPNPVFCGSMVVQGKAKRCFRST